MNNKKVLPLLKLINTYDCSYGYVRDKQTKERITINKICKTLNIKNKEFTSFLNKVYKETFIAQEIIEDNKRYVFIARGLVDVFAEFKKKALRQRQEVAKKISKKKV